MVKIRNLGYKKMEIAIAGLMSVIFIASIIFLFFYQSFSSTKKLTQLQSDKTSLNKQVYQIGTQLNNLKSQDQYKINKGLESRIASIEATYKQAVTAYESLLDLKTLTNNTGDYDKQFADVLSLLSEQNYASAESELTILVSDISSEQKKLFDSFKAPKNLMTSNKPPDSGYQVQSVSTDMGNFMVEIVSADLGSTKVIVDTTSDSDCSNNCPALSLSDYVSRNGAFAGINGSFFCPADYPSCAGKTNSFDTLLMNKNKTYFNSSNNVYSTVPAVIFYGGSARYVTQSLQWGRDTGADAVIANHPLLTMNGQINLAGNTGEAKLSQKSPRSFIGSTGSTVYIGVVLNATVTEEARVMQSLGIQNSLNLDDGGSTALWYGGYKAGPGRNIPNAVLFVKK